MSQSERERALRAAAEIAKTQRSGWRLNTSGNMASDLIEKNILALIDQPAALDTPQEPATAAPPDVPQTKEQRELEFNKIVAAPRTHTNPSQRLPAVIYGRYLAGESVAHLAWDYGIPEEQVQWGIRIGHMLAAAPRPALSPDALRQLIAEWRAEARKNIPDDYTKRHLEHKYLKLDNYASGLDDCADVLEDLLRAPAPREGA